MKNSNIKFIHNLTDALGRSEKQPIDDVVTGLKECGIDVDASMKRMMNSLSEAARRAKLKRLDLAKEERLSGKEKDSCVTQWFGDWSKEKIIERIREILGATEGLGAVGVAYRELANKEEDDLRALLQDLENTIKNMKNK